MLMSQLLPSSVGIEKPITVIDVGPAVSGSVRFFDQLRGRICYLDLFNAPADTLDASFREISEDIRFDLCLLWDYLHVLDRDQLKLFAKSLHRFLQDRAHIHFIGAYSTSSGLQRLRYQIDENGLLIVRSDGGALMRHPYSATELTSMWPNLTIRSSTMLSANRVGMLLVNGRGAELGLGQASTDSNL